MDEPEEQQLEADLRGTPLKSADSMYIEDRQCATALLGYAFETSFLRSTALP